MAVAREEPGTSPLDGNVGRGFWRSALRLDPGSPPARIGCLRGAAASSCPVAVNRLFRSTATRLARLPCVSPLPSLSDITSDLMFSRFAEILRPKPAGREDAEGMDGDDAELERDDMNC